MKKNIIFLCNQNSCRSQIAQVYFNKYNKNKKFIGVSAGVHIAASVNPICMKALEDDGFEVSGLYPKNLTSNMVIESFRIYSMGCDVKCDLPDVKIYSDLEIIDPTKDLNKTNIIRDEIKNKVLKIVDEIKDIHE